MSTYLPRYSPDGTQLAYLAPSKTYVTLWLRDASGAVTQLVNNHTHPLAHYQWAPDGQSILFLQDTNGDENWVLYRVVCATGEITNLTPYPGIRVHDFRTSPHDKEHVVVVMNKDKKHLYMPYRVTLATGKCERIATNPGDVKTWLFDHNLFIRGKVIAHHEGSFALLTRRGPRKAWKRHITWGPDDTFTSGPLWFSHDGSQLYITDSRHNNTAELCVLDLENNKLTHLLHDREHDIRSSNLDDIIPQTALPTCSQLWGPDGKLAALSYYKDRLAWHSLTAYGEKVVATLKQTFPTQDIWIADATCPQKLVIGYCSDRQPPRFSSYDLTTHTIIPLWPNEKTPDPEQYVTLESVTITSRDGTPIPCYLSRPKHGKPAPLVVNIHGGPWWRFLWGFDEHAQFLARNGYACLQINYRGSTGYGKAFVNAGDKNWTDGSLNDVEDATNWAIAHGICSPDQIAVMGRSFGGYLTLAQIGMRSKPAFKCAIANVAITHMPSLLGGDFPAYWTALNPNLFRRIGNPFQERQWLEERSPVNYAHTIAKTPLLLLQGKFDARVNHTQSDRLFAKLQDEPSADVRYVLVEDEGHRTVKKENVKEYYREIITFLDKHLKEKV